jgi:hypothetical protein
VKGKNLVWYSLITILFISPAMIDTSFGQNLTRLYVDPDEIEGVNPCCDPFDIEICIEDVEDLYAYGFTLGYAPYARVLVPILVTEGPFLAQGGPTVFIYKIDPLRGQVEVACTLKAPGQRARGSGMLVIVKFKVVEAGESNLKLVDTALINSRYEFIVHDVDRGRYKGPKVEIVNIDYKYELDVSEKQTFNATVKKRSEPCLHEPDGPPLWAFVRFDISRLEDGKRITLTTDTHLITEGTLYTFPPVEWYPDAGTYVCTSSVCFSYFGALFNEDRKVKTFSFIVHQD